MKFQSGRSVQQYDVETHNWKLLAPPPMDIENSGCTVLPNKKVLILGSTSAVYRSVVTIAYIEMVCLLFKEILVEIANVT